MAFNGKFSWFDAPAGSDAALRATSAREGPITAEAGPLARPEGARVVDVGLSSAVGAEEELKWTMTIRSWEAGTAHIIVERPPHIPKSEDDENSRSYSYSCTLNSKS